MSERGLFTHPVYLVYLTVRSGVPDAQVVHRVSPVLTPPTLPIFPASTDSDPLKS